MATQNVAENFYCDVCAKAFPNKINLRNHMVSHSDAMNFKCRICPKSFRRSRNLSQHMGTHSGTKDFECGECQKTFSIKSNLARHLLTHTGIKDFECEICHKSFHRNSDLSRHRAIHTGLRNFKCGTCHKSFLNKSDISRHMASHTDIKNFKCGTCHKGFTDRSYLRKHALFVHKELRSFHCGVCSKSFMRKGDLAKHSSVHGIRKFDRVESFSSKYKLRSHMELHKDIKGFPCDLCSKVFVGKRNLSRHVGTCLGSDTSANTSSCEETLITKIEYEESLDWIKLERENELTEEKCHLDMGQNSLASSSPLCLAGDTCHSSPKIRSFLETPGRLITRTEEHENSDRIKLAMESGFSEENCQIDLLQNSSSPPLCLAADMCHSSPKASAQTLKTKTKEQENSDCIKLERESVFSDEKYPINLLQNCLASLPNVKKEEPGEFLFSEVVVIKDEI